MKVSSATAVTLAVALGCGGCAAIRRSPSAASSARGALSVRDSNTVSQRQAANMANVKEAEPAHSDSASLALSRLSPASLLLLKSCDNYLATNPSSEKAPQVLSIKASVLYNNRLFEESRDVYQSILENYPTSSEAINAIRMIAQSYYETQQFALAEQWYTKLRQMASESSDKEEALARIAESVYRMAQRYEEQQHYKEAAAQYERVALEFPESKIADVSLYNAGLAYEKLAEWTHAVLCYEKLMQRYQTTKLLTKARFRIAKSFEKLLQWEHAAEAYLRIVVSDPTSELAPTAMYNAAFCFENANMLVEAATTFEKMAYLFPNSNDAADVLFRAGEIFGRLKDWKSVSRVNQEFTRRFGSDQNRIVQALCMEGIALYMQDKRTDAVQRLQKAVETFKSLKNPSAANRNYAANAQYTLGEIAHESMRAIALTQPESVYRKQLKAKSDELDRTIKEYSKVLSFAVLEWNTRAIFQMGQANDDFAMAVLKQQRPATLPLDKQMALEVGIAQALEEYLVNNAVRFHEQNVKLGIKEKTTDKYIAASKQKLTALPLLVGQTYLSIVAIYEKNYHPQRTEAMALIGQKLEMLQRIAPYQERAMNLFLKCLELGTAYDQIDDAYHRASILILATATNAGRTYSEVATLAREAPLPAILDKYERFAYKTKLLKHVESYEDRAIELFLKTLKIAQAYQIDDTVVTTAKTLLARLLFERGRCFDLLGSTLFSDPPYPDGIDDAEKEEYRAQFEEVALKMQEQAMEIYRTILTYAQQGYAEGKGVTDAYVRLYQYAPKQYGVRVERIESFSISSGPQWKCSSDSAPGWNDVDFVADSAWRQAEPVRNALLVQPLGFPDKTPTPMWLTKDDLPSTNSAPFSSTPVFFRRTFSVAESVKSAHLFIGATGSVRVFFNGQQLTTDTLALPPNRNRAQRWDVSALVRKGKNVIAACVINDGTSGGGFWPFLDMKVSRSSFLPQPPGRTEPMDPNEAAEGKYAFDPIKNFSPEERK